MATKPYIQGRQKYGRPQAMLWSENSGTLIDGVYVPNGLEIGSNPGTETNVNNLDQFLILSDDNRASLDFKPVRIEKRERMINGRMRSYHTADKLTLSTSWNMLPSRAHALDPEFNLTTGKASLETIGSRNPDSDGKFSILPNQTIMAQQYTTDGGAGGVELLDWYENHKGSFWVYLAYDKYSEFGKNDSAYGHLSQYNQLIEMFISDFSYTVVKRGASNFDFWNISVTLEEA
jgi:hypothetical protein